jgi:hypothetical protein
MGVIAQGTFFLKGINVQSAFKVISIADDQSTFFHNKKSFFYPKKINGGWSLHNFEA